MHHSELTRESKICMAESAQAANCATFTR